MSTVWITREVLGDEYRTAGGHKLRRRHRETIDNPDRLTEKEFTRRKLGGASFLVEWQARVAGKLKRFARKMKADGLDGFRQARLERNRLQAQLDNGEFVKVEEAKLLPPAPPPVKPHSLQEAVVIFERDRLPLVRTESTRKDISRTLKRFVDAIGCDVPIVAVGRKHVDQFTVRRQQGKNAVAAISVNKDLRYLRLFFRTLADWELIPKAVKVSELRTPEPSRPVMTIEQFEKLMAATKAAAKPVLPADANFPRWLWWRAALAVYWESGIRRCELLGMKWSDVDLPGRRFVLESASTKTKQKRTACLGDMSAQLLAQLRGHAASDLVFPWPHGSRAMNDELDRMIKAAGIDKPQFFGFHSARHAVGENIGRVSIDAAQARLGHKNRSVTTRYYAKGAIQELAASVPMPIPESLRANGDDANPSLRCCHDVEGTNEGTRQQPESPVKCSAQQS